MKRKIICLILVVASLFSMLSISVFAVSKSNKSALAKYEEDIRRAYLYGFDDVINIEEYASLAGTTGFDEFRLLRVGAPTIVPTDLGNGQYKYTWTVEVYFYNPTKNTHYINEDCDVAYFSMAKAYARDNDDGADTQYTLFYAYIDHTRQEENETDEMFFKAYITGSVISTEDFMVNKMLNLYIREIGGFQDKRVEHGTVDDEFLIYVDKYMELSGIDYTLKDSDPLYDLANLYGLTKKEISRWHVVDESADPSVVYMYESLPGTKDFNLFLYIYDPQSRYISGGKVTINMYLNGQWIHVPFTVVNYSDGMCKTAGCSKISCTHQKSRGEFVKLELAEKNIFMEYAATEPIRMYAIQRMRYDVEVDGIKSSVNTIVNALFEFSENSFDNIPKTEYVVEYDISFPRASEPEKISLTLLNINVEGDFNVEFGYRKDGKIVQEGITVNPVSSNSYEITELTEECYWNDLYNLVLRFFFENDFQNSTMKYDIIRSNLNDADFVGPALYSERFTRYGAARSFSFIHEEVPTVYNMKRSSSVDEKYIRSNVTRDVEIKCTPTYYRLDSSSTGRSFYSTISSIGFSLPKVYLGEDGIFSNSKTKIDYIDIEYVTAYITGLLTTYDNFISSNFDINVDGIYEMGKYDSICAGYQFNNDYQMKKYIYYGLLTESQLNYIPIYPLDYNGNPCYLIAGENVLSEYIADVRNFDWCKYLAYCYIVDDSFFTSEDMIEGVSSKDLLNDINKKQVYSSNKTTVTDRIDFNDTFDLLSAHEMSLGTVAREYGYLKAFSYWLFGLDDSIDETVKDISPFHIFYPNDYASLSLMTDEVFSNTYYVGLGHASEMRQKALEALENDECYILMRYDVYDYFCSSDVDISMGLKTDDKGTCGYDWGLFCDEKYAVFNTKVYEDVVLMSMQVSDEYSSKIITLKHDPFDAVGDITNDVDKVEDAFYSIDELDWNTIGTTYGVSLIGVIALVLGIAIVIVFISKKPATAGFGAGKTVTNVSIDLDGEIDKINRRQQKKRKVKKRVKK